ncbi:hypothetical protein FXB40_45555 [Bradyrhizobium rifense]|uniref:Uncharacterized protein n=1 Tax=Bradyrhizobium rifense TaxID=515499 RepID=A0A5D3JYW0_9BRAD|nr:hypothetical protein [Bradyrhizobium rifense]TYL84096.1 hypothetical protein FXB40_45555 [Bradyrhizobium rifense]
MTILLEAAVNDIGIDINCKSDRWSITFDLEKIDKFKAAHGADRFIELGCRYVEERCDELGLVDDLWLWLDAVRANGRAN